MLRILKNLAKRYDRFRRLHGRHQFTNRSSGSSTLVIILAGYKPELWAATLNRIAAFSPDDHDICLCCAGRISPELSELASTNNWSLLTTKTKCPNLAMNLTICKHPNAHWIFKMDEDIFIGADFFTRLRSSYEDAIKDPRMKIGAIAPMLNVNGFSYRLFLEEMDSLPEYESQFGPARQACGGIPAFDDGDAAQYLWSLSLPFDEVAARISNRSPGIHVVPHRFSIGAILFERELWSDMGYFRIPYGGAILGEDEIQICHKCHLSARHMTVANNVFAGHWSFGPQSPKMNSQTPQLLPQLMPQGNKA